MKQTDLFNKLDNVIGNWMDDFATDEDLIKIALEVNRYLIEHPHPHSVLNTDNNFLTSGE